MSKHKDKPRQLQAKKVYKLSKQKPKRQDEPVVTAMSGVAWGTDCVVFVGRLVWFCFGARNLTKQEQEISRNKIKVGVSGLNCSDD